MWDRNYNQAFKLLAQSRESKATNFKDRVSVLQNQPIPRQKIFIRDKQNEQVYDANLLNDSEQERQHEGGGCPSPLTYTKRPRGISPKR